MEFIISIVGILIAYLFGSIPMGYLVAWAYGIDVTDKGSGRTGGTNVLRAVGVIGAGLTVMGDVLKGLLPVYLLVAIGLPDWAVALAASATVIGHNHSIFLGFRGGVGAGAATGAMGGLNLFVGLIVAAGALVALALTGYASVLSTTVAVVSLLALIAFAVLGYVPYVYILAGIINVIVMFYALRPNFERLRKGTERRVGNSSSEANA